MNILSWVILAVLGLWLVLAIGYMRKHKGGCSSCTACSGHCDNCNRCERSAETK